MNLIRIECKSIRSMDPMRMGTAMPMLGVEMDVTPEQRRDALSALLSGLSPEQSLKLLEQADGDLVEMLREQLRQEVSA
jgi:hypothetical protein